MSVRLDKKVNVVVRKYLLGESNKEELREAISFIRNPGLNQKIINVLEDIWIGDEFSIPMHHESKNLPVILQQIHEKIYLVISAHRRQKGRRLIYSSLKIAAILIIGLILGFSINGLRKTNHVTLTSIAPKGSISQVILPDSTLVYLNSGSELKYTLSSLKSERQVFLQGEAFFQVKENKQNPFVVHTLAYDVEVTGTEFNVKAYKNDKEFVTTLVKGSVTIPSTDNFKMESNILLSPGQQVIYNAKGHSVSRKKVNPSFYTSWRKNKLIFINLDLGELLILLERKYGVEIEVTDKTILNYHYDGTITNESILEVLEILKITLPIQYEIKGQKIQISKKGE